jgi:cytochrome c553
MLVRLGWKKLGAGLAGLLFVAMLVAWSGIINIAASGGHWPATSWFLHWVMRNSVQTHAAGMTAPDLADAALVRRGAGHYATGCAPCHGAPGEPQNPIVRSATPSPPNLLTPGGWRPRELFWIVKHGVKYTGMPAWAAPERDDEVWAMVAFLLQLPEMDAPTYRRLSHGAEAAEAQLRTSLDGLAQPLANAIADCARCHGRDGLGDGSAAFPIIAGQSEVYLLETLRAYAAGKRRSGIMQSAAARPTDEELRAVAKHYAAQPFPTSDRPSQDPNRVADGATIVQIGVPSDGVPRCLACHGEAARARNPHFPSLDGQHAEFVAGQLRLWQGGGRGGGPYAHLMATIARRMTPDAIDAVAVFFASRGAIQEWSSDASR